MILNQSIGTSTSSNAVYAGFGAFIAQSYNTGPSGTAPTGSNQNNKQFIGEIQALGISDSSVILDASMGIT